MTWPRIPGRVGGRDLGGFLAIGLCGAAVRLAFAWQYTREPLGRYPWVDEASYWTWAQSILRGDWWPLRPFYQDPLYPYWLAGLMRVVGTDVAVLRLASAGLGALTPLAVAWAARAGLGRAEGFIAGWAAALYGPLIFADGSLEKEGLATFWTALALGLMAMVARSDRPGRAGAAGMAWGVVGLLRSNALIIAPLALGWLVHGRGPTGAPDSGRRWRAATIFLAGFLLVVMPVAAVNTSVSSPREWLGTTWQLGPNFYIGNGPGATGTYMAPPFVRAHPAYEPGDYAAEAMRRAGHPLTPGQVSRFWLAEGLRRWRDAPLASIQLLGRKLALLTHHAEIPDNQDIDFVRIVAAPALGWGVFSYGLIFPLAAIGLARVPRSRFWWLVVLATGLGLLATAFFFVVGRYRVPWVPGLILLASAGLVDLGRLARLGDWRAVAWRVGALGLPAALLCWRPQADAAPARWGNQLIALGVAELRAGRIDRAIDALDLARASSPAMAASVRQQSLGGPLYELLRESIDGALAGEPPPADEARRALRRARLLRQLPDRVDQARALLEARRQANSGDAAAAREWGAVLLAWPRRPDDRDRAIILLRRAARDDHRARLLASLVAADPGLIPPASGSVAPSFNRWWILVRAILTSRTQEGPDREPPSRH